MTIDITKPTNEADAMINLIIAGNYLVRMCNTIQQLIHEKDAADKERRKEWYAEVNEIVERVRDQLSEQRCAQNKQLQALIAGHTGYRP